MCHVVFVQRIRRWPDIKPTLSQCIVLAGLYVFLLRRKISSLFFRLGKIDHISHYCLLSGQILSYFNIFNINRNLLTQAFTWM